MVTNSTAATDMDNNNGSCLLIDLNYKCDIAGIPCAHMHISTSWAVAMHIGLLL